MLTSLPSFLPFSPSCCFLLRATSLALTRRLSSMELLSVSVSLSISLLPSYSSSFDADAESLFPPYLLLSAVLFIFLIFFWMRARRNRMHASNLAYAQNQQTQMGRRPQQQQYGSSQPNYGQGPNGGYPSQSYGQNATGMYNASEFSVLSFGCGGRSGRMMEGRRRETQDCHPT